MAHIVCLLNAEVEAKRATFTWSEGPASFEPYTLDGMDYGQFHKAAETARSKLADLINDCLNAEEVVPKTTLKLAKAGYKLRESLFPPDNREAKQVREWIGKLTEEGAVETLEIVLDSPWSLPWNVIYDQEPKSADFVGEKPSLDRWSHFWAVKYDVCGGRKVDPLRRMPVLKDPHVLFVVDPNVQNGLPQEQQERLAAFAGAHDLEVIQTKDELEEAIEEERPDVLYWLSHASPDALKLSEELVTPLDLRQLLRRDTDEARFGGLAFLNACRTAEIGGEEGSFFEAFHKAGFAGMIGTEHRTIDTFANPLGLDFLEAFLDKGESIGSVMRRLRSSVLPVGLLYGTYCPPDVRVERGVRDTSVPVGQVDHMEGVTLGVAETPTPIETRAPSRPLPPLPAEPYRSLAFYRREDRALFAGRDDDVERFAMMLDDAAMRILVLHGESGVGKSSFLRAGVIPYLEDPECIGYRFLRDRSAEHSEETAGQESVLFIRATNDLFGQLAQTLCDYCAAPFEYSTPTGEVAAVDLPGILEGRLGQPATAVGLQEALHEDLSLLGRLLSVVGEQLPFTLVLVIDQGEEVFTLARTPEEEETSQRALKMLRHTVTTAGNFKIILSLRTEYYGRLIDVLRRGLTSTSSIREYLLTDFDQQDLVDAIQRPTKEERIPYASEKPFDRYGFWYDEGVPERIAREVIQYTRNQCDSVLPLVQVICSQLYERARQAPEHRVGIEDLDSLGGVEGGLKTHVEDLLRHLVQQHPMDITGVKRLFTRLFLRQPDGSLTTALMPEDDLRNHWRGRTPFDQLVRAAERSRLLRVNSLRIGGEEERRYVSLGHDSLANLAADWDEQLGWRKRMLKIAASFAAVTAVALVMAFLAWDARRQRNEAERNAAYAVEQKELAENHFRDLLSTLDLAVEASWATEQVASPQKSLDTYGFILDFVSAQLEERRGDPDLRTTKATTLNAMGRIRDVSGNFSDAEQLYTDAKDIRELVVRDNPTHDNAIEHKRLLANSYMNLGRIVRERENPPKDAARKLLEDAQKIRTELVTALENAGDATPPLLRRDLGNGYLNLGMLDKDEDELEGALKSFEMARCELEIVRSQADESTGGVSESEKDEIVSALANSYRLKGDVLVYKDKPQRALECYEDALRWAEPLHQDNPRVSEYHSIVADVWLQRGRAQRRTGDIKPAKISLTTAERLYGDLVHYHGDQLLFRLDHANALVALGQAHHRADQWNEVVGCYRKANNVIDELITLINHVELDENSPRYQVQHIKKLLKSAQGVRIDTLKRLPNAFVNAAKSKIGVDRTALLKDARTYLALLLATPLDKNELSKFTAIHGAINERIDDSSVSRGNSATPDVSQ